MNAIPTQSSSSVSEPATNARLSPQMRFAAMILGAAVAFTILTVMFTGKKTDFEDAATFGAETTSIFAAVDGHRIHCSDARDVADCIAGVKERHVTRSVVWLGNSQVHAVNQLKSGQTNSTPILFEALKPRGLDLVTFSQPNANLQEHYVLFEYLRRQVPMRTLILPLVFDDLREEGLRDDVAVFARDPTVSAELAKTEIGRRLVTAASAAPENGEMAGIAKTAQERVERSLTGWLDEHSTLWRSRPEMRGYLIGDVLYKIRNTVFGIKPTSKRKILRSRYQENIAALEAILSIAKSSRIDVVMYIAPFRGGIENPYDDAEYAGFKSEAKALGERYGVTFANLEALVPEQFWGRKDATSIERGAELDFMHFQAQGHQLLADQLTSLVARAIERSSDRSKTSP